MVAELLRKVSRELNFVRLERCRDEDALPTDLWRKPVTAHTSSSESMTTDPFYLFLVM